MVKELTTSELKLPVTRCMCFLELLYSSKQTAGFKPLFLIEKFAT
jgi:hypothetical protein